MRSEIRRRGALVALLAAMSACSAGGAGSGPDGAAGMASSAGGASSPGSAGSGAAGATSGAAGTTAGAAGTTGGAGTTGAGGTGTPTTVVDVFGITMFKASKAPRQEWTSLHWGMGALRSFTDRDPSDPTGWSTRRGDSNLAEIDGKGVFSMGGAQPRLYIQPKAGQATPFFRDVEFSGYYRRTASDGASNSGFSVGLRAHLNGHGDVDHCLASTYYLIFRNSGTWIFDKELDHPADSPGKGGSLGLGGPIPVGKWIGMKYLAYNLPGDKTVKLEAYIDTQSDGDTSKGGSWTKLGETIDDGNWTAPTGTCGFPANTVVTEGGGVVFIRNTAVAKVQYTKVSWREIVDQPAK